jgi:hypothetical protein
MNVPKLKGLDYVGVFFSVLYMFNLGIDPTPMIPPMIRILLITLLLSVAGMIGVIYQHRQQLLQQTDLANFSGATARPLDQVITQSMPLLLKRNIVVAILYLFSILSFTLLINALVMELIEPFRPPVSDGG